ncbi:MAG: hypothetical protein RLZZ450_1960 [Pseudomonadota bacterium]|jgi:uncharacterized membrane protein
MNHHNMWGVFLLLTLACSTLGACGSDPASSGPECPPASTLTYADFGKPFLTKYCSSCHAASVRGSARQAAPTDDVFDTVAQVRAKSDEVVHEVSVEKSMPFGPGSLKPSAAEREQFGEWVACGAPD